MRSFDIAKFNNITYIKAPVVSLSKKLYSCCLVLVGSRNGFERDFTIKLK